MMTFIVGIAGSLDEHSCGDLGRALHAIGLSVQLPKTSSSAASAASTAPSPARCSSTLLPELLRIPERALSHILENAFTIVEPAARGDIDLLVVLLIIFEPDGLAHRSNKIKAYWKFWPFSS